MTHYDGMRESSENMERELARFRLKLNTTFGAQAEQVLPIDTHLYSDLPPKLKIPPKDKECHAKRNKKSIT